MMFIYPMWDNESQRIGKKKCTPLGYALHGVAELLGFIGFLLLLAVGIYLGYRYHIGTFHKPLLWILAIPFGIGLIGEVLYHFSWRLARRRGFHYDYDTRQASWMENGQRIVYTYSVHHPIKTDAKKEE